VNTLPPPLDQVRVDTVRVSQAHLVASSEGCPLRAFAPSDGAPLPTTIEAERGTLAHIALEIAVTGRYEDRAGVAYDLERAEKSPAEVAQEVLDLAERASRAQMLRARHRAVEIRRAWPVDSWEVFRSRLLRKLESRLGERRAPRLGGGGRGEPRDVSFLGTGIYSELPLQSLDGRIRGRVDRLVVSSDGGIEIWDDKTGSVVEDDGRPKASYALQLALYGRMFVERGRDWARVKLFLSGSTGEPVAVSPEIARESLKLFDAAYATLPTGTVPAHEVARVGPACRGCSVRHRCTAYLSTSPGPRENEGAKSSLDVGGRGERVDSTGAQARVDIRDDTGTKRRILDVEVERWGIDPSIVGTEIAAFELVTTGKQAGFPRNFYDQGGARDLIAWSSAFFARE